MIEPSRGSPAAVLAARAHAWPAAFVAALVVMGSLHVVGCEMVERPLRIRKVLVDVEPDAERLGRERIRAVVEGVLRDVRGMKLTADPRGEGGILRVRVEGFSASVDEGQLPRTTLALSVEVTGIPGEAPSGFRGQAVAAGTGAIDARDLVEQAMRDALAQVLVTRGAADLDSDELISWLNNPQASGEQKRRAVRVLGSRRERLAVAPLGEVLAGDDRELQALALNALANIGDPAGVDAVLAYADRQSSVVTKQCIEAVRAMGSRRGKAWLFTLSTGHPEVDVQRQAAAALAWVEANEAADAADAPDAARPALAGTAAAPPDRIGN